MKSVLVTGATGFVGGHFIESLRSLGYHTRGLVRSASPPARLRHLDVAVVRDLLDREGLRHALAGVDTVVHLAARVHRPRRSSHDEAARFHAVNVDGTAALLDASMQAGVSRFLLLSSVSAIGDVATRLDGDCVEDPNTEYGRSKLRAEEAVREAAERGSMRCVILRPPGIYGPEMKGNILRLFRLVSAGIPIPVPKSDNARSLLYVGNLVDASVAALRSAEPGVKTYLVADDEALATAALVRVIGECLDVRPRTIPVPGPVMRAVGRVGDMVARVVPFPLDSLAVERMFGSLTMDTSAIAAATGFKPRYSVKEGMMATAQWFKRTDGG